MSHDLNRHYLDYASTAPLRPEAKAAMVEALDVFGDPGRVHSEGLGARQFIEECRAEIAEFLGAKPREVIFTSGATESIKSAIHGVMAKSGSQNQSGEIVTTAIEHSAVLESVQDFPHTILDVNKDGLADPWELKKALTPNTALISIQHANHEIGTLQDLNALEEVAGEVVLHIDAAQSIGHIPFSFADSKADLVSVSAHKFGGPPGIGALLIRQGLRIEPLLKGGSQERARRSGMENLPAIAGFAAATKALNLKDGAAPAKTSQSETEPTQSAPTRLQNEAAASAKLIGFAVDACEQIEGLTYYGPPQPAQKVPHIACFGFADLEPQAVLLELDKKDIAVHSGSACASEELEPSSVLEAIGVDAKRSLRISVGWNSTKKDIEAFISELELVLKYLRKLGSG